MITAPDVAIDELHPHPRNYQQHPDDQLDEIGRSITEHGYFRNVVVAADNTILAGHGVVAAARRLGHSHVPVLRLDVDPDSPQALKVLVADNEISRLAEVDDRALTEMLKQILEEAETALAGTGFDEMMLAALVMTSRTADEIADLNATAEWVGLPGFEPADQGIRLMITFDDEESRANFVTEHGFEIRKAEARTWQMIWPHRPYDDLKSVQWQ